jgi:hypothetical protein
MYDEGGMGGFHIWFGSLLERMVQGQYNSPLLLLRNYWFATFSNLTAGAKEFFYVELLECRRPHFFV